MTFAQVDMDRLRQYHYAKTYGITEDLIRHAFDDVASAGPREKERIKLDDEEIARMLSGKTLFECLYFRQEIIKSMSAPIRFAYVRYICRFFPKYFVN